MSTYDDASLIYYPSGYKAGKAYSLKPTDGSGDLTFTRASTATRVNAEGLIESVATGVPRIDYTGGGCGKLLLEPQRTNSIGYSEDFSDAYWTKIELTVSANAATSPDGTTNSDKLIPSTANGRHSIVKTSQAISGGYYTVYAKADGYDWILLTSHSTSAPSARGAYFNVANGTIGTEGSGIVANVTDMGNGWYKCSINDGASPSSLYTVIVTNADNTESFAGNGTDGVLIWGAQNEQGSYPTSYIPTTTGVAVTRTQDTAAKTGISSLIGQTEGTILLEIPQLIAQPLGTFGAILSVYTSSSDRMGFICINSTKISVYIIAGGVTYLNFTFTPSNGVNKIALGYANNDAVVVVNGTVLTTDTSIVVPPSSAIALNNYGFSALAANTSINQVQLFTTRLSNAELETLTTI